MKFPFLTRDDPYSKEKLLQVSIATLMSMRSERIMAQKDVTGYSTKPIALSNGREYRRIPDDIDSQIAAIEEVLQIKLDDDPKWELVDGDNG